MSERARKLIGVEAINKPKERWTGAGEVVAVVDSGIDQTHPDLKGAVSSFAAVPGAMSQDEVGHGTHVSGTIAGRGKASDGKIRGMAPAAELVGLGIVGTDGSSLLLPLDLGELLHQVADKGAKIINLSWGTPVGSSYESGSQAVDTFAAERPEVLVVVAAGNCGRAPNGYVKLKSVETPATAKNVLTVGACASDRPGIKETWTQRSQERFPKAPTGTATVAGNPALTAAMSSRGPSDGGAVKPELLAPGTWILAPRAKLAPAAIFWGAYTRYGGKYGFMGGTSMATPVVSGAAAVLRQYLREEMKIAEPSAALLRAALVAGAVRLPSCRKPEDQAKYGYPDFDQGFGRLDLATVLPHPGAKGQDLAVLEVTKKDDDALESRAPQGSNAKAIHSYLVKTVKVPKGSKRPLRIVLAWTDCSSRTVQNILGLDVRGPEGLRLRGNEEHHWPPPEIPEEEVDERALERHCDERNNVQRVVIEDPAPGEYHVRVSAENTIYPPQGFAICACGPLEGGLTRER